MGKRETTTDPIDHHSKICQLNYANLSFSLDCSTFLRTELINDQSSVIE